MSDWGNLQGLVPLLGGIYGFLLAHGTLPRKPKIQRRWNFGGASLVL